MVDGLWKENGEMEVLVEQDRKVEQKKITIGKCIHHPQVDQARVICFYL